MRITGPAIGNPKTATFRLIDLGRIDSGTCWQNLAPAIPHDQLAQKYFRLPESELVIETLVARGALVIKSNRASTKKCALMTVPKSFWSLNLQHWSSSHP